MKIRHHKSGKLYNYLLFFYHFARAFPKFFGSHSFECSCCGYKGKFLAFGYPPRFDAICVSCGSFDRHRLMYLWLRDNIPLVSGKRILHFAPEEILGRELAAHAADYKSADYHVGKADLVMNIEETDLPDGSVDVVICVHVLEHVDDTKALREIHRILSPGGIALLMVPIVEGWSATLEESDLAQPITSVEERIQYFGQYDHVRFYGRDFRERIRSVGFDLEEFTATEPNVSTYALVRGEKVFIATRTVDVVPAGSPNVDSVGGHLDLPRRIG